MARHYIAMSGTHGCLPDHCQSHSSLASAVNDLGDLFDLAPVSRATLQDRKYFVLPRNAGADYAEITICHCTTPAVHNDN